MTNSEPSRLDRIEATQAIHSQILNELAVAHRQIADFSTRQAERQQQRTNQLENTIELIAQQQQQNTAAIANLTSQMNFLGSRVDALTTTTTETIQLVAQNSVAIRDILERLDRRFNNGNGRSET
ncbi:hypothetical protein BLD44_007660 [Mastigocladus laminosus UU774]|nr:hypothetical protein BLD44_007660 [Mastigocladus laminosus UU774]